MHPAASVIVFTTSTGFGYGILMWYIVVLFDTSIFSSLLLLILTPIALVLITIGLLSSTFHLGHPERAWRALSQWRSSWLSREGVMALITYLPGVALMVVALVGYQYLNVFVLLGAVCAALTVYTTSMIYASLKPIPAWSNIWTIIGYQTNAFASGGVLMLAVVTLVSKTDWLVVGVIGAIAIAWLVKWRYWRYTKMHTSTTNVRTALGLSDTTSRVTLLDPPHSSPNYLMKEMGFVVARTYAKWLRIGVHLGFGCSLALLLLYIVVPFIFLPMLALLTITTAIICERYLFFAEAKHVVMHYYRP